MNRQAFVISRHRISPELTVGCRVRPRPGIQPWYYWNENLRGVLMKECLDEKGQDVYVQWDGYDKSLSLCRKEWLAHESI